MSLRADSSTAAESLGGLSPDLVLREYRPGDEAAILVTFHQVFPHERERTLAEWRWQFLENPAGWRIWLALAGGRVVAQSAGLAYRVLADGRECAFSQSVDSMVHPAYRAGLKNPGLFVRTVHDYITAYGGTRDTVFFGWPNRAAERIGRAFLGYETLRAQVLLARELRGGAVLLPDGVEPLHARERDVHALWNRCRGDWRVSVARDERFLAWRFRDAPRRRYEWLGVYEGRALLGCAAARVSNWPLPGAYVIADWLVPAEASEVGERLRRALEARARTRGARAVVGLFPEWSRWFERFRAAGYGAFPSGHSLTVRIHRPELDLEALRDGWWYQLAESDFV